MMPETDNFAGLRDAKMKEQFNRQRVARRRHFKVGETPYTPKSIEDRKAAPRTRNWRHDLLYALRKPFLDAQYQLSEIAR